MYFPLREVIMAYLKDTEPDAVKARRHRRLKRRRFYAAGVYYGLMTCGLKISMITLVTRGWEAEYVGGY